MATHIMNIFPISPLACSYMCPIMALVMSMCIHFVHCYPWLLKCFMSGIHTILKMRRSLSTLSNSSKSVMVPAVLMMMVSHRTFSSQIHYLSGQIKFGQTNLLYIINGEVIEFTKENEYPDNFQSLS